MIAFARGYFPTATLVLALALTASSASAAQRAPGADGQEPGQKVSGKALAQGCGNLPKTEVIVNSLSQTTSSVNFVDVEGSDTSFKIGGSVRSCVIVSFAAQAFAPGPLIFSKVRALLDGAPSIDGEIQLAAESENFSDAHAYNFLFPSVAPGSHVFSMQYRSPNADEVSINDFDINIRHR
jgi:hypothetical protein